MKEKKSLHVSAGGRGERIASYIAQILPSLSKHLLPIPTKGETIIGEIVLGASENFREIMIWSNENNHAQLISAMQHASSVIVRVDGDMSGPLGPMIRHLLVSKSRTFGCAGDFYCDFSWEEFEKFHDSHGLPVSILVAESFPALKGMRLKTENEIIVGWERVDRTTEEDLINIGCYIVDPSPEVVAILEKMKLHKEDGFFEALVPIGIVAGYKPKSLAANVNTAEVYRGLVEILASKQKGEACEYSEICS